MKLLLILLIVALDQSSNSVDTLESNVVEYGGPISLEEIDTNKSLSVPNNNNNSTIAVPYLTPFTKEEYKDLKEKAKSGELTPNTNVTTPPMAGRSLEELIRNENATSNQP